jgi:hypothetical protein
MEYRILGSIEVLDPSGRKLPLGGAMRQSVLASLLLRVGQTVVLDRLVDELWDEPPATAARTVQAYVSRCATSCRSGPSRAARAATRFYSTAASSTWRPLGARPRRDMPPSPPVTTSRRRVCCGRLSRSGAGASVRGCHSPCAGSDRGPCERALLPRAKLC